MSADVTAASGTRAEGNNNSVPLLYSVPISLKTLSHRASCLRDNNGQHGKTGNARTTDETEDDAARASVISEHWVTTLAVGHWKAFEELVDSISSVLPSKVSMWNQEKRRDIMFTLSSDRNRRECLPRGSEGVETSAEGYYHTI